MGEGLVLESGSHRDLLKAEGAYARLVQAQKLRENDDQSAIPVNSGGISKEERIEEAALENIPLGRKNTQHSQVSETLEKRKKENASRNDEDDYSLPYLFKRMAPLIRDQWRNYLIGSAFACGTSQCYLYSLHEYVLIFYQ